ncbi:MAG TPA: hypothetical protein VF796_01740 [Humisphaera sp.]
MFRPLRAAAVAVALFALHAPAARSAANDPARQVEAGPMTITEADAGKVVRAKVGQPIEVRLEGTEAKTGWEASAVEGAVEREGAKPGERGVCQDVVFTPTKDAKNPEHGTYAFRYVAKRAGRAELRFVYVYPGGPVPVPRTATKLVKQVRVTVEVGA